VDSPTATVLDAGPNAPGKPPHSLLWGRGVALSRAATKTRLPSPRMRRAPPAVVVMHTPASGAHVEGLAGLSSGLVYLFFCLMMFILFSQFVYR